jgi:hypothetical protein
MGTVFLALALSIAVCMIHAAATRRFHLVQGGAPLLVIALLLALPSLLS